MNIHPETQERLLSGAIALMIIAGAPLSYALSYSALQAKLEQGYEQDVKGDSADATQKAQESILSSKKTFVAKEDPEAVQKVQKEINKKKKEVEELQKELNVSVDATKKKELNPYVKKQEKGVLTLLQKYTRQRQSSTAQRGASFVPQLLGSSVGRDAEKDARYQVLSRVRMRMFSRLNALKSGTNQLAALRQQKKGLQGTTHAAAPEKTTQSESVPEITARTTTSPLTAKELKEIQNIVADVEGKILNMQSQLSEYDERIRERAEKALIARGLKARIGTSASKPRFQWPAVGRITATFLDPGYHRYFGVPHKAIDIAVNQGSPIRSSSEGIVHYVQHGGAYGYSYILIGHRGGYATLYGHMLQIYVQEGQDISGGQIIGLSGGRPGTVGAGPMTTGPHLHFEMILNGEHIDPQSVLP